jgi:hypothetical protein
MNNLQVLGAHVVHRCKAHPVVPGSSTYRGGGRKSETGLGFQFSGALSRLSACRWQFCGLLARAGLSRRRSLVATQCPLAPAAAGRRTAPSYHISGNLGQRDEPYRCGQFMGLISLVAKSDWWRASETRRPVIDTWLHGCSGTALKATPLYSNSGITVNVRYSSQGFAFLPANIARSLWQVQPNAMHPKDTGSIHARTGTTDYERPSKTPAKKHIVPRAFPSLSLRIRCGTPSRSICSNPALTCGPFSSCLGIVA